MVCTKMVFALLVSKIFFPGIILDDKPAGFDCIKNPEKSHFH